MLRYESNVHPLENRRREQQNHSDCVVLTFVAVLGNNLSGNYLSSLFRILSENTAVWMLVLRLL